MNPDEQFLNTRQVAEILGVHQKTVHQWLRSGRLAGTKISYRAWRIPRSSLDVFIRDNSNVQKKEKLGSGAEKEAGLTSDEKSGSAASGMKHYIRDIMGEEGGGNERNPDDV